MRPSSGSRFRSEQWRMHRNSLSALNYRPPAPGACCRAGGCRRGAPVRPGHLRRPLPCSTDILSGSPNGWSMPPTSALHCSDYENGYGLFVSIDGILLTCFCLRFSPMRSKRQTSIAVPSAPGTCSGLRLHVDWGGNGVVSDMETELCSNHPTQHA